MEASRYVGALLLMERYKIQPLFSRLGEARGCSINTFVTISTYCDLMTMIFLSSAAKYKWYELLTIFLGTKLEALLVFMKLVSDIGKARGLGATPRTP